ncbi:MAG: hypothetical protein WCK29_03380 [archaeon]
MLVTQEGTILPSGIGVETLRNMRLRLPELAEIRRPLPYQNPLSLEEQEAIRRNSLIYLFDNDVINLEDISRLGKLFERHLNDYEWNEVSRHPEDYWPILIANQLRDEDSQRKIGNHLYKIGTFTDRNKQDKFNLNQMVWIGRAVELYPWNNFGREAGLSAMVEEIIPAIAPVYRAYYGIKMGIGQDVNYIDGESHGRIESYRRAKERR